MLLSNIGLRFIISFRSFRKMSSPGIPNVIFVLGGPGAGKGTQCRRMEMDYGFKHLSAGELLREEMRNPNSEFGELINGHMKNGTIVPSEITCKLLKKAMFSSSQDTFLIDGFPRNRENFSCWSRELARITALLFVLILNCPNETCVERCLSRGAAGSGRTDDNQDSILKRIIGYEKDTMPVIESFRQQKLVKEVDSTRPIEDVSREIKKLIDEIQT